MTVDLHPQRKGGRRPPVDSPRLALSRFLREVPEHPVADLAPELDYPMDLNDRFGVCVVAGTDHALQVIAHQLGMPYRNMTSEEIIRLYRTQNPDFDPATGAGDNGMVIQEFLAYLAKQEAILGFAEIDVHSPDELKAAVYLGLAVWAGVDLTNAQVNEQFETGVWDHKEGDPEAGGHCVPLVGYHPNQTCVTWATLVDCTPGFLDSQLEEAWLVITAAHIEHAGFREHFDLAAFAAAYTEITGRPFPQEVTPAPVPSPTPADPASFRIEDLAVAEHVRRLAVRAGKTADGWLTQHLQHYFGRH